MHVKRTHFSSMKDTWQTWMQSKIRSTVQHYHQTVLHRRRRDHH